ncbi:hypothetical protein MGYG_03771 [Nannizzia gypsea CBS 118893]|uniref:Uncharacterized protein n=1 Tax=Arthroderma gypseum (strain ATCC MYA-4604 / CBS 118893) TaxID=535722 RepID=E4UTW2_ARTGP|nr:hypothetical protein MGYG_03771 [Nannizzia gypsea CBS 118893]EFR00768.1 hypothetical protein MGYG_03771 [Nannizzia gypsea CBS 118893]
MSELLDVPFGLLSFDQFVAENWDPASSLSKHEQKRVLVEKRIGLGKYNRNASIYEGDDYPHADEFDNPTSIFDNREDFTLLYEDEDKDKAGDEVEDGLYVAPADIVPRFLLHILMRYPSILDGESDSPRRHKPCPGYLRDGELDKDQVLLVLVADREILPFRIKDKASWVVQQLANWSDSQQLAEGLLEETLEELYVRGGDGWASNEPVN